MSEPTDLEYEVVADGQPRRNPRTLKGVVSRGEPTLDDLRVPCEHGRYEAHRFLSPGGDPESSIAYRDCPGGRPAEFDRIATEQGYVKRPVCGECGGQKYLGEFEHVDPYTGDHLGNELIPCQSCGGTGFGRLYVGRCSECGGDLIRCVRVWAEGKKCCPDCVHPQVLASLDGAPE